MCPSCKVAVTDRNPLLSTKHIYELYLRIIRTMVPVFANPLVGLDLVLRDGKVEFKGYFRGYGEFFLDNDDGATMGTHCRHTKNPNGRGKFRSKA